MDSLAVPTIAVPTIAVPTIAVPTIAVPTIAVPTILVEKTLSVEQQLALDKFKEGKNIFLTGPGGSGKTELIKRMVQASEMANKRYQVCALTGCAAILLNCKAKTVHSWAGIGLAGGSIEEVVRKVIGNKFKIKQWKSVDILIIDEVSMMSLKIFEILDLIGRKVRKNPAKPFGGIQVVFSGDFYQLPPVGNDEISSAFCFESDHWPGTFYTVVELKTIFRQTDQIYTTILNQIRVGKLYKSSLEHLNKHINKVVPDGLLFKPTILLPKRKQVELINVEELAKLGDVEQNKYVLTRSSVIDLAGANDKYRGSAPLPPPTARASEADKIEEMEYNYLVNNTMADKEIILKIGSQVMCVVNIDMESPQPIVNGSQGVVMEFIGGLPVVQFNNGSKRTIAYHNWISENVPSVGVKQIPLIHAWAITIHKAQGVSLDLAQIDAGSNIFECGQTYVALSRIKSMEGLYLTAFDPQKIKVNKKVQDFYTNL
jgi:ATP-dependent DNA helicase PIF1